VRAALLPAILLTVLLSFVQPAGAATEIPFAYGDGMIWLKVTVAGQSAPLNFLLDSGAGVSVLDLSAARRLGLKFGGRQTVAGVHSHSAAYPVSDFTAHAAGIPIASSSLAVDLSGPSRACHQRIDGLIGMDFFRERIVQIDFAAQKIRLLQSDEVNEAGCEILPLTARNDSWCARVSVDGNAPEWLRLDTGCNSSVEWVVTGGEARKCRFTTAGPNSVRECRTDLQLGLKRLAAVKTGIHTERMFAGEMGLIGNGLLSRFTVTIDSAKKRCLLASR
jgi:hypothetical protein